MVVRGMLWVSNAEKTHVDQTPHLRPRIAILCHADETLNRHGLTAWLNSWADLVGVVAIREDGRRARQRIRREIRRVGWCRFLDVVAFRIYAKFAQNATDQAWEARQLGELQRRYGELPDTIPVLETASPNSPEAQAFLLSAQPDLMIARCKTLLAERIFSIPPYGTFVMHPGICPRYRNAHGVFWALANDDATHAGMTLLRIDCDIDTGPVFGYFRCEMDPLRESHIVLQHRTVFDNLPAIESRLKQILAGTALPLETQGEPSKEWGQPWLTAYLRYRQREAKRRRESTAALTPFITHP